MYPVPERETDKWKPQMNLGLYCACGFCVDDMDKEEYSKQMINTTTILWYQMKRAQEEEHAGMFEGDKEISLAHVEEAWDEGQGL